MNLGIDPTLSKRIGTLAVPVILGMFTETLVNHVDTALVGRLPGSTGVDGVAAIGLSLPLFWAIGGFFSSISVGTQAITARRFGEGQMELAGRALSNSLVIALACGLCISLVGWFVIPEVFPLLSPNPNVARLGAAYCQIRMLNVFSMVVTFSFKSFFDAIGKTYVHMIASITMNFVNIGMALLLVYGNLGFPRLEVAGSAWATLIATYVGLGFMVYWSLRKENREAFRYFRLSNLNRHVAWEIVRLSVPSGLATIFVMSGFEFFLWVMGHIQPTPVYLRELATLPLGGAMLQAAGILRPDLITSASWIMISFLMMVFMISIAFGTATATLVGQSLGAGKPDLAERYGWQSVRIGGYVMGLLGVAIILFPRVFLAIFTDKVAVIEVAVPAFRLMGAFTGVISAGLVLVQALYGAGNPKFVMKVELLLHFGCLIPLSYLLGIVLGGGMLGTWSAAAVYAVLLTSILAWKFRQGKWKQIQL
ncbi:MAG TPA: MATE family efflux transporter [Myxococcota bacterium]|nr:MATE family efflux transporter [Myxococcota bacterium]HRY91941.1 MATE family efflux transporter [Myxococcota bacterium]HSA21987.1 MATE family efflux transporter [Myxococcota bacterium]